MFSVIFVLKAGAGDTYFSGKMLGKLARILLIADEVGGVSKQDFDTALGRLYYSLTSLDVA